MEHSPNFDPKYAQYFDHTDLHAEATKADIERFCSQAREYGFAAVCVNPYRVKMTAELLKGSGVHTCTVVGFPLGANLTEMKVAETKCAVRDGAEEIDMVINIGALKDKDYDFVRADIKAVVEAAKPAATKVIVEIHALTEDELVLACQMAEECGAKFVKTCSGFFGSEGATIEAVKIMRATVSPAIGVKASTGIRTRAQADAFIAAGAVRFGSSAGPVVTEGTK